MTVYLVREKFVPQKTATLVAVIADSPEEAINKANDIYSGKWELNTPHSSLKEIRHNVEDSAEQAQIIKE